jgi:hypothetical protein
MKMILWLTMAPLMAVALIPAWAQQPKFEIADVHNSTTLRQYAVSVGPVFMIGWTAKGRLQPAPQPDAGQGGQAGQASEPNGITVFEATERELGLRLVKQKRTIPMIVVDHVDEKPIE